MTIALTTIAIISLTMSSHKITELEKDGIPSIPKEVEQLNEDLSSFAQKFTTDGRPSIVYNLPAYLC